MNTDQLAQEIDTTWNEHADDTLALLTLQAVLTAYASDLADVLERRVRKEREDK